jgi:hypothetical protein
MKINRTFTMDLSSIELLAKKPNKSLIVNLAVKHYFNNIDEFEVMENITTRRLMTNLKNRSDIDETLKIILTNLLHLTE